jgi:uncharacterized RDD family membrane protein YckC
MNHSSRLFFYAAAIGLCLSSVSAVRAGDSGNGDRVAIGADNHIAADDHARHDAVDVMGNLSVDGYVAHDAVAVFGSNTVNGSVDHDVVAVMGDVAVNGRVGHDVVAVMGDVTLGPGARVGHDVVSVGGKVYRDPAAIVGGNVVQPVTLGRFRPGAPFAAWLAPLRTGRMLSFGPHFGWLWALQAALLAFYALLALVFPRAVGRCGDLLAERPGLVVLAGLLGIFALPVLFVLLLITVIGIPVALLALPLGVALLLLFGKASVYGLIGRRLAGGRGHPAADVLLGGLLVLVLLLVFSLVPLLGLMFSLLLSALGFGCATTALFSSAKRPEVAATPTAPTPGSIPPSEPPASGQPSPDSGEVPVSAEPASPPILTPPSGQSASPLSLTNGAHVSMIGLPRAGFWIRAWALLIDGILVALVCAPFREIVHVTHLVGSLSIDSPGLLPMVALYGALMWKLRGTTIGGIIFGLKVVRLDDRPIDWATAIVRALGCFLSLAVIGLGFFWVAFDDEKQSWHDKIAGTVVVRLPKGISLI